MILRAARLVYYEFFFPIIRNTLAAFRRKHFIHTSSAALITLQKYRSFRTFRHSTHKRQRFRCAAPVFSVRFSLAVSAFSHTGDNIKIRKKKRSDCDKITVVYIFMMRVLTAVQTLKKAFICIQQITDTDKIL